MPPWRLSSTDWHRKVCSGTLTLRQAQKLELAYKRAHG
jgi:hypothetical protein